MPKNHNRPTSPIPGVVIAPVGLVEKQEALAQAAKSPLTGGRWHRRDPCSRSNGDFLF